jgi:two-component system cell cycle response regulator DivK
MPEKIILIIDDNPLNLKLISLILELEHHKIFTAGNAEEALDILKKIKPDLILMDLQMPGMDGLQLTQQLKSQPQYKNVLIVALTAYAMVGDKERALAAGCDGYISKPIDTKRFPEVVADYLAGKIPIG